MSPTRSREASRAVKRTLVRSDMRRGFPDMGQVTIFDCGGQKTGRWETGRKGSQ